MPTYSLAHLAEPVLLRDLAALVDHDRATTAWLLAHLAEVDARRLYLPAAYPSMHAYCVHELHLCPQAAFKRILAAGYPPQVGPAPRFPALFAAAADGRLHLSAVVLLAPHLTEETAEELLAAAAHQTKSGVEQLLAARFPRPELPTRIEAIGPPRAPAPWLQLSPGIVESPAPGRVEPPDAGTADRRAKISPLAPARFALQLTIAEETHDKLRYAQALLGHAVPSGDVAAVLDRAFDALIETLERRRFAATPRPRGSTRPSTPAPRPRPRQARGMGAGWGTVHVRERRRPALPGAHPARV